MAVVAAAAVKFYTEEVFYLGFKGYCDVFTEEFLKFLLALSGFREEDEVVYVQAEVYWWLVWEEMTDEDARGVVERLESDFVEDVFAGVVPVPWTAAEAIEGFSEAEKAVWRSNGATGRRSTYIYLVVWEYRLAEGLGHVS